MLLSDTEYQNGRGQLEPTLMLQALPGARPDDMAALQNPEHNYNLGQKYTSNEMFLIKATYTSELRGAK